MASPFLHEEEIPNLSGASPILNILPIPQSFRVSGSMFGAAHRAYLMSDRQLAPVEILMRACSQDFRKFLPCDRCILLSLAVTYSHDTGPKFLSLFCCNTSMLLLNLNNILLFVEVIMEVITKVLGSKLLRKLKYSCT